MKRLFSKSQIIALVLLPMFAATVSAQELPERQEILDVMVKTNDYFMKKWPDVGKTIITNRERPSHIWTRGVYYEGLMALHQIYPKAEYYKYALDWGTFHEWGMRNGNTTRNADDQCCGQTYIDLYNMDPQPERIRNIKICMDMLVNTPQVDDWTWIDAIQMGMPVFAQLGKMTGEKKYYDKAHEMYMCTRDELGENGLYNPKDGLWWRDADFDPPYTEPNGEDCYWSRGNGWVVAALVRVLELSPEKCEYRSQYESDLKAMFEALVKVQREDGFWNVSLHDADNYGGKETTGTSLFVYGMAWGINHGIIDKKTYYPIIVKAWNAMVEDAVHENGFLGYVQSTGKEPKDGQPVTYDKQPDFEDYGLGCFLLAGSELYKMK